MEDILQHFESQRSHQESLERYNQKMWSFEAKRLSQWRVALRAQSQQRAEFDVQQRLQVQAELTQLSQRRKAAGFDLRAIAQLRAKQTKLKHFNSEIMKPIDEQIADAVRHTNRTSDSGSNDKLQQQCDGRWHASQRINTLLSLNQIPDELEKFTSQSPEQPERPTTPIPPPSLGSDIDRNRERSQDSHGYSVADSQALCHVEDQYASRMKSHQARRSEEVVTLSLGVDIVDANIEPDPPNEEGDEITDEDATEQQEPNSERLGAREIAQRDRIIRLQNDFRRLDRSAMASMVKGRRGPRRDSKLITLLQYSRNCAASDPRDRVYAFLGLAESGYNIIPDYRNTVKLEQVLIETAKSIIRHDQSLDILQHVHRGRAKLGVRLPSWVPDWTSKETVHGIDHYEWEVTKPFDAGQSSGAFAEFHRRAEVVDGFYEDLKVRGVFVGKIDHVESDYERECVSSITLSKGEYAFGPKAARFDDEVWVLCGATRPTVLRPEGEDRFGYLGDALIFEDVAGCDQEQFSTIMYGHMLDRAQEGKATVKIITIV